MSQMRRQLSLAGHGGHMRVLQARCAYVGIAHDAAIAEAARQGAPAAVHAAIWRLSAWRVHKFVQVCPSFETIETAVKTYMRNLLNVHSYWK